jgi:hypothetical protein
MGTSTHGSSLLATASTTRAKSVGDDRSPASSSSVVIAGGGAYRTPLDLSSNAVGFRHPRDRDMSEADIEYRSHFIAYDWM